MPSSASAVMTASTSLIISGSSALVGSSNSITLGSIASDRAIATRCCWPPESCAGYLSAWLAIPDPFQQGHRLAARRLVLAHLAHLHRGQRDVLQDCLVREQVERLEHHAHIGAQLGELAALRGQRLAVDADGAGVDGLQPVDGAAQRRFARTGRAQDHDHLTACDLEVDVLEHMQAAEMLVDRLHRDHRHFGGRPWALTLPRKCTACPQVLNSRSWMGL